MMVNEICEKKYNKPLSGCTNEEIYYALLDMTKDLAAKKESEAGKKKVYYISAEFLIGKAVIKQPYQSWSLQDCKGRT